MNHRSRSVGDHEKTTHHNTIEHSRAGHPTMPRHESDAHYAPGEMESYRAYHPSEGRGSRHEERRYREGENVE